MNQFTYHNESIRSAFEQSNYDLISSMIDLDEIDIVLRNCLTIDEMREAGSFFTGQKLAKAMVDSLTDIKRAPVTFHSVVLDPTCGTGNLLIEISRRLGVEKTLSKTLKKWGDVLWGFDIFEHFIEATKLRIACDAVRRGVKIDCDIEAIDELLPNIRVQDAMTVDSEMLTAITHVVMNPPFSSWPTPNENYWKKGKVNAAGVVFDRYLRILPKTCTICAILPDVLRTGTRYDSFRSFVNLNFNGKCVIWGQFGAKTDVDVFILSGSPLIKDSVDIDWVEDIGEYLSLSELYDVKTGPLVAYRDVEEGDLYPYFFARNCPAWKELNDSELYRRFKGKVVQPPFVLIKRTSSPSERFRASATIINMNVPVAVENHMIVVSPKSGTLRDCRKLLKVLKSDNTNKFLNQRARTRHLTVKVVKDIPL